MAGRPEEDVIMHAVRIHQFGDESVLRCEEMPEPQPGLGQVRVAVQAASINRGDLARRAGTYPGADLAREVSAGHGDMRC